MIAAQITAAIAVTAILGLLIMVRVAYSVGDSLDAPKDKPEPLDLTIWQIDPRPAEILNHGAGE